MAFSQKQLSSINLAQQTSLIQYLSQGNTFKTVVYAINQNEIQVRANNLEDRFDENPQTYVFDTNKFARQYYFEANAHLFSQLKPRRSMDIMNKLGLEVTEMNLAGSVPLEEMKKKSEFTKWRAATDAGLQAPKDHMFESNNTRAQGAGDQGSNYTFEPQRIRVFNIKYMVSPDMDIMAAI